MMRRVRYALLTGVVGLVISACTSGGGNEIAVSLSEWQVVPTPQSISSGEVTFAATNNGGEAHEMVVVKDVAPADLPTDSDGAVVEDEIPAGALIGEIEEFDAGTTESATFDLAPGTYTIFCNITETGADGTVESHFANGMVSTVTVN